MLATKYISSTAEIRTVSFWKSMPVPGTSSIREIMSAKLSWPCARSPSTNWSLLTPAGSCLPTTPPKMTSMAWPSTFGAMTLRTTDTMTMATTM